MMGTPYIAKLLKQADVMGQDRRPVPDTEVINAVEQWTKARLSEDDRTLSITDELGQKVMEITIFKNT